MRRATVLVIAAALSLLAGAAFAIWGPRFSTRDRGPRSARPGAAVGSPAATPLAFHELLAAGPELAPSAKARALDGKRVRVVGFMAEMEEPILGAFYLVARPLRLDESGGGTGDLPLSSILVAVPGAEGTIIPHAEGALEGTGVLEVGNRADDQGRVSNFRLRLDPDERLALLRATPAATFKN
jgi:hypothetical protein